jgi:Transposase domain (DUF772)
MSMQPRPWPEVPADTARVARRAFRKGTLAIRARDELGAWYDDEAFAAACGARGKPGISPAQLAMVTVLQFTENLTDRQAADAVRGRLDWKYCLGLALEHEGFDYSLLSEFWRWPSTSPGHGTTYCSPPSRGSRPPRSIPAATSYRCCTWRRAACRPDAARAQRPSGTPA